MDPFILFGLKACVQGGLVFVHPCAGNNLGPQLTQSCLPAGDGVVRAAALLVRYGRRFLSELL